MRVRFIGLVLVSLSLGILSCAAEKEPEETPAQRAAARQADLEAINQIIPAFSQALNSQDLDALLGFFSDDAIRMPPDQPAHRGGAAIRAYFEQFFAQGTPEIAIAADETELAGDWAYSRGTYSIKITPAEGDPQEERGKWLNILRRQSDGSWKISRNAWNRDRAPGE